MKSSGAGIEAFDDVRWDLPIGEHHDRANVAMPARDLINDQVSGHRKPGMSLIEPRKRSRLAGALNSQRFSPQCASTTHQAVFRELPCRAPANRSCCRRDGQKSFDGPYGLLRKAQWRRIGNARP